MNVKKFKAFFERELTADEIEKLKTECGMEFPTGTTWSEVVVERVCNIAENDPITLKILGMWDVEELQ